MYSNSYKSGQYNTHISASVLLPIQDDDDVISSVASGSGENGNAVTAGTNACVPLCSATGFYRSV